MFLGQKHTNQGADCALINVIYICKEQRICQSRSTQSLGSQMKQVSGVPINWAMIVHTRSRTKHLGQRLTLSGPSVRPLLEIITAWLPQTFLSDNQPFPLIASTPVTLSWRPTWVSDLQVGDQTEPQTRWLNQDKLSCAPSQRLSPRGHQPLSPSSRAITLVPVQSANHRSPQDPDLIISHYWVLEMRQKQR